MSFLMEQAGGQAFTGKGRVWFLPSFLPFELSFVLVGMVQSQSSDEFSCNSSLTPGKWHSHLQCTYSWLGKGYLTMFFVCLCAGVTGTWHCPKKDPRPLTHFLGKLWWHWRYQEPVCCLC
jgi:hypothetical protein